MTRVAVLGVGVMGGGMARRVLAAGFPLTVWNRTPERMNPLEQAGAVRAATPREAAAGADVILSMVADDDASRTVWTGTAGALDAARAGVLLIESSTLSPSWVEELATRASQCGCHFLEAPVTGSRTHAADGQLLFLAGGDGDALDHARPILDVLGRGVVHLGPVGSGARMKLINNFVCGVQVAALAEAIALIERSGLALDAALTILLDGAPGSPLVNAVAPRMASRDYTVAFTLALMRKDLTYAIAEGESRGVPLSTAAAARRLFDAALQGGWGHLDFSAVIEAVRTASAKTRPEPIATRD
jgi:3-hydroxyisobutyrate dehydrogenase